MMLSIEWVDKVNIDGGKEQVPLGSVLVLLPLVDGKIDSGEGGMGAGGRLLSDVKVYDILEWEGYVVRSIDGEVGGAPMRALS